MSSSRRTRLRKLEQSLGIPDRPFNLARAISDCAAGVSILPDEEAALYALAAAPPVPDRIEKALTALDRAIAEHDDARIDAALARVQSLAPQPLTT